MKNIFLITIILASFIVGFFIWNRSQKPSQSVVQQESGINSQVTSSAESDVLAPKTCTGQPIPELTEGPYYTPNTPQRQNIREEGETPGEKLLLEGYVFDTNCEPITGAWIDFWQADGDGHYDNTGYALRGQQYTDENGKYVLEAVVPGEYPGRTEHIHFKIRASDQSPIITSQLFFPGSDQNETDSIFHESLIIEMSDAPLIEGKYANYNIIIPR